MSARTPGGGSGEENSWLRAQPRRADKYKGRPSLPGGCVRMTRWVRPAPAWHEQCPSLVARLSFKHRRRRGESEAIACGMPAPCCDPSSAASMRVASRNLKALQRLAEQRGVVHNNWSRRGGRLARSGDPGGLGSQENHSAVAQADAHRQRHSPPQTAASTRPALLPVRVGLPAPTALVRGLPCPSTIFAGQGFWGWMTPSSKVSFFPLFW
jgi:hypothetical protein